MYDLKGERKYLTKSEIDRFLIQAKKEGGSTYAFCWVIAMTGCRISEALSLTRHSIDFEEGQVIILCLKKRMKRVFRAIPLPPELLTKLGEWIDKGILGEDRLWPWSRMTGYRRVRSIMSAAGLNSSCATPKGLRHGFAVRAIQANVPLNIVQRWLGHSDIKTTAIYTNAIGPEEREFASRLWHDKRNARRLEKARSSGAMGRHVRSQDPSPGACSSFG